MNRQRGITGLETAIILIAFVVVASVFAFTVLSTGIFSSERSEETVYSGIREAQSTLEPRGGAVAYRGKLTDGTETVYKITFNISNAVAGKPVDLTPPYTTDDFITDPDPQVANKYVTVISYSDKNQFLLDVPWTLSFVGTNDGDNLLEDNEMAEITVWLLDRNTPVAIGSAGSISVMDGGAEGGDGGFDANATVLAANDQFKIAINPARGAVLNFRHTLPAALETVMALN